jgi:hypothetical protein
VFTTVFHSSLVYALPASRFIAQRPGWQPTNLFVGGLSRARLGNKRHGTKTTHKQACVCHPPAGSSSGTPRSVRYDDSMYWSIRSFPELQHLSESDRETLMRQCKCGRAVWNIACSSVIWGFLFGYNFSDFSLPSPWLGSATSFVLFGLLGDGFYYQFLLRQIRRHLREYLRDAARRQRLPMCLNCGYSTNGLVTNTCPECGAGIGLLEEEEE